MSDAAAVDQPERRHRLFAAALKRAEWNDEQLWIGYMGNGGAASYFDLQAFLHGLLLLTDTEQDILATAVNERLADLYTAAQVPYLTDPSNDAPATEDALTVIDELLRTTGEEPPP